MSCHNLLVLIYYNRVCMGAEINIEVYPANRTF